MTGTETAVYAENRCGVKKCVTAPESDGGNAVPHRRRYLHKELKFKVEPCITHP